MSSVDILTMCVRNLFKRKLRTILTILGVTVGTACIVIMISLGLAINLKFEQQLETMGDVTIITVYDYGGMYYGPDSGGRQEGPPKLDDKTVDYFDSLPGVVIATPIERTTLYFKSGKYIMDAWTCLGIKPEAMTAMGYTPLEGRLLQDGDQFEVVFGFYAETMFRDPNDMNWWSRMDVMWSDPGAYVEPLVDIFGDKITMSFDQNYIYGNQNSEQEFDPFDENAPRLVKPYDITVVGLLEYKNDRQTDSERAIFFDIDILKKLRADGQKQNQASNQESGWYSAITGSQQQGYETVYVKCTDLAATKEVQQTIQDMGFYAYYQAQWLDQLQEQAQDNQNFLLVVGMVSLFVAALGIANTMIMSIYERTREIGVMKVIGAAIRDIKWLFLLESALIGFVGGIVGVCASYLGSYILNNAKIAFFAQMFSYIGDMDSAVSVITPWLACVALTFASLVGLLSGYFPARRAMRLSALSAIRTE